MFAPDCTGTDSVCACVCVYVCALHLLLHATLEQHGDAGLDGEGDFSPANVQVLLQRLAERRLLHPRFCKNKLARAAGMFGDALLTILIHYATSCLS